MRTTKTAAIIVASILFVAEVSGALPNQDAAKDLLERVAQTYTSLTSYHFEGTVTSEIKSPGTQMKIDAPFVIAAIKPDRMRVEIKSPAMGMESIKLNELLPDALFIFTPPEGAREVKQFNAPQKRRTN